MAIKLPNNCRCLCNNEIEYDAGMSGAHAALICVGVIASLSLIAICGGYLACKPKITSNLLVKKTNVTLIDKNVVGFDGSMTHADIMLTGGNQMDFANEVNNLSSEFEVVSFDYKKMIAYFSL